MTRVVAMLVVSCAAGGCSCERRDFEQRLGELRAQSAAVGTTVELASFQPAAGSSGGRLVPEPARVWVSTEAVTIDVVPAIDAWWSTPSHVESRWTDWAPAEADDEHESPADRGAEPPALHPPTRIAAIENGAPVDPDAVRAGLDRLVSWMGGSENQPYQTVALFADRSLRWRAFEDFIAPPPGTRWYLQLVAGSGPLPVYLPYMQVMSGSRCRLSRHSPEPYEWPEPGEPMAIPVPSDGEIPTDLRAMRDFDWCDRSLYVLVDIRDDGHRVQTRFGSLLEGCTMVRPGDRDELTVPRGDGDWDYDGLRRCLRELQSRCPSERHVRLEVSGDSVTLDDYVDTWEAMVGTEDEPLFVDVY